jgi:hypothetical protein
MREKAEESTGRIDGSPRDRDGIPTLATDEFGKGPGAFTAHGKVFVTGRTEGEIR